MTELPPPSASPPPPPSGHQFAPPRPPAAGHQLAATPQPSVAGPQFAPPRPPHGTLPWQAGAGAVAVLAISLLVSKFLLDLLVEFDWPIALYVAILGLVGYGPSVAWWLHAVRRWGSGRPLADVGARPEWVDLAWGPLIWLAAVGAQAAIAVIVIRFEIPISNNTDGIEQLQTDRSYVIALVITAVIAAPLVEEMVFRGLVMRSLLSRVSALVAIPVQGLLFGAAHVDPVRGWGNIGLALVLTGVGTVFGGFAYLTRRIGPTIVAHAIFNGVVMLLVLTGIRDRIVDGNDPFASRVGEQVAVVDQADVPEPDGGRDPNRAG